MSLATSLTSPKAQIAGKDYFLDVFHIDEVPSAMDKMGWTISAKMMRRWFATAPAYEITKEVRAGTVLPHKLKTSQYDDQIIKVDWALGFQRCVPAFEDLVMNWCSTAGIKQLRARLDGAGWTRGTTMRLGSTRMCARELEDQVNYRAFGNTMDTIDDLYGALGNALFKLAVVGEANRSPLSGKVVFEIGKIGVYIRDTYDFTDVGTISEPLGIWSKNRILNKLETAAYLNSTPMMIGRTFQGFVPVFNKHFRRWQKVHNSGGDFVVFSDVMWLPSPVSEVVIP